MQEFHKTNTSDSQNKTKSEEKHSDETVFMPPQLEKMMQDSLNFWKEY